MFKVTVSQILHSEKEKVIKDIKEKKCEINNVVERKKKHSITVELETIGRNKARKKYREELEKDIEEETDKNKDTLKDRVSKENHIGKLKHEIINSKLSLCNRKSKDISNPLDSTLFKKDKDIFSTILENNNENIRDSINICKTENSDSSDKNEDRNEIWNLLDDDNNNL